MGEATLHVRPSFYSESYDFPGLRFLTYQENSVERGSSLCSY